MMRQMMFSKKRRTNWVILKMQIGSGSPKANILQKMMKWDYSPKDVDEDSENWSSIQLMDTTEEWELEE